MQAAGHANSLLSDAADHSFVLKPYDEQEWRNYQELWSAEVEPLQKHIARVDGVVEVTSAGAGSSTEDIPRQRFMRLTNFLAALDDVDAVVMDCKMCWRTFSETECDNPKPRKDLYKRLNEIAPEKLTPEEHAAGAITKFRFQSTNDHLRTTGRYAFRVDGIMSKEGPRATAQELHNVATLDGVLPLLMRLLPRAQKKRSVAIARQIHAMLELLHVSLEDSPFFRSHEFIGTSLLFVAHSYGASVHLIDLAKTEKVPEGTKVDHVSPWKKGNHEDGFLFGLAALTDCWRRLLNQLEKMDCMQKPSLLLNSLYEAERAALEDGLRRHGVNVTHYGVNGAKPLQELHREIYKSKDVITYSST